MGERFVRKAKHVTMDRENSLEEHSDMTEKSSRRVDNDSTQLARQLESDDINENTRMGSTPSPDDGIAENKVATSLDNE